MDHVADRDLVVQQVREELVGPSPQGRPLDCNAALVFEKAEESYGPWIQKGSGEEILQRDSPTTRYGIGVLYPVQTKLADEARDPVPEEQAERGENTALNGLERLNASFERLEKSLSRGGSADEDAADDFDLSPTNAYRPSSMGLSFLAELPADAVLSVEASGGRYLPRRVHVAGVERQWWLRESVSIAVTIPAAHLVGERNIPVSPPAPATSGTPGGPDLHIDVLSRPHAETGSRLLTVCLINRRPISAGSVDENSLFQASFRVTVQAPDGRPHILPYPEALAAGLDVEEQSLALLYRAAQTFAVGHGCAAEWSSEGKPGRVMEVWAECLPTCETPSITPDVTRPDFSPIEVAMKPLAGLDPRDDGFGALTEIVTLYESWIEKRRLEIPALEEHYHAAAERNLADCERCAKRMRDGLAYLREDNQARYAFQLANRAMLLQQISSRRPLRLARLNDATRTVDFSEPYASPDPSAPPPGRGKWRAFQIAFLLMSLRSSAEGFSPDRDTVELIWFPTGGGKTEAYLALAAFSLFMRRLHDPADSGVHVLMRYTLRLLTAQQFQRACALICAMESLRRAAASDLGSDPFSIGIWVGGSTTPNTNTQAVEKFKALANRPPGSEVDNPFLLTRCPWCGAEIGPVNLGGRGKAAAGTPRVLGYSRDGDTVVLRCSDRNCTFAGGLPVHVVDQDIYRVRPSMVIGTVDKFAMLAWRSDTRSLFGIDPDGKRFCSPPGLIIQDELHLISGPLGSMVGLYETIIAELCTDRRIDRPVQPKLVSSTATIRRYVEQIRALYAREHAALFPPPGLDAGDSFFARYAQRQDGTLERGRLYIGVHAPGLGSIQTAQVRTFAALLQAPLALPTATQRDPWWTLLLFYNSLRELGGAVSLFQSDIPDYLRVMRNRLGRDYRDMRHIEKLMELTGRLRSNEVSGAITDLEIDYGAGHGRYPVDVCFASNIIEVGIDIDRLSLMAVIGQPKTTSQYIQVTGRVGRRWSERPGLVLTIYSASKPRDRSHFERFRTYHERLYAQVEPTSVTPFSPPAVDRALHAIMAAYARQTGDHAVALNPYPYHKLAPLMEHLRTLVSHRVRTVDPQEEVSVDRVFRQRVEQWHQNERTRWGDLGFEQRDEDNAPLLRPYGEHVNPSWLQVSWPTPTSMRDVDAECEAQVTELYLGKDEPHA